MMSSCRCQGRCFFDGLEVTIKKFHGVFLSTWFTEIFVIAMC